MRRYRARLTMITPDVQARWEDNAQRARQAGVEAVRRAKGAVGETMLRRLLIDWPLEYVLIDGLAVPPDERHGFERGSDMEPEQIARVAHEANRAYCQSLGDNSQPAWEDAPQWQRDSAMLGVKLHTENPNAGAQAIHESWMAQKLADGWEYGPTKDPEAKRHPCIVPFDALPKEQQAKDYLFRGVVHALAHRA